MIEDIKEVDDFAEKWKTLKDMYLDAFTKAKENFQPLKHLIAYLTLVSGESPSLKPAKPVDEDYAKLSKNNREISDLIPTLEELIEKRDAETLKKHEEAYATYSSAFNALKYLEGFTEEDLFKYFTAALLHDSNK